MKDQERITGRVSIRENFDRIDYQFYHTGTMTNTGFSNQQSAGAGKNNNWVVSNPILIQNKKLRLIQLRASSRIIPATAGTPLQNPDIAVLVSQDHSGAGTAPVFPIVPKTGLALSMNIPQVNATNAIIEEPESAYYNSKWGGNCEYNHIFVNSFDLQWTSFWAGILAINDIVETRIWLTFRQERSV